MLRETFALIRFSGRCDGHKSALEWSRTTLAGSVESAVDLVFPRECLACGDLVDGEDFRHLCRKCARRLFRVADPCCETCGYPFFGELEGTRMCPHCVGLEPAFCRGRTLILLRGPGRALVHALKYRRAGCMVEDVERLVRESREFLEHLHGAVLVPVPLHSRKLRERGYNQSLLLARAFARAARVADVSELLQRIEDTESQTQFDRKLRYANLKNAFAMRRNRPFNPKQKFVLVDDVFTTGSTLNACARVLRASGIENLDVATFGHG